MKCTCSALSRFSASSSARAGRAVASGAARLLVVGLQRPRHARVDDRAHVRLVHAHPEGVGGADHPHVVGEEAALHRRAPLAVEAGVVGRRLLAEGGAQLPGQLLRARPRAGVHDRRQRIRLAQRLRHQRPLLVPAGPGHPEGDVGPVEARGHAQRVAQAEPLRHVDAPRAEWPWPWRPAASPRRACGRRRPGGSSRAGSRGPTATRSAPRPPRTAPRSPRACARGSRARRSAPAPRRAGAAHPPRRAPAPPRSSLRPAGR